MHLKGGSFDISKLKITEDLRMKECEHKKIIVVNIACTPSQKLKEGHQSKFYSVQLVYEVDEENLFTQFQLHPYTSCDCPVGCIVCAHIGSFVLLLNVLNTFDTTRFENIRKILPTPVDILLAKPMFSGYAFPKNNSTIKIAANEYRFQKRKRRVLERSSSDLDDEIEDDFVNPTEDNKELKEYAFGRVLEVSNTPVIPVVKMSLEWAADIKNGRDTNGELLKRADRIDAAFRGEAIRRSELCYKLKKLKVEDTCLNTSTDYCLFGLSKIVCGIEMLGEEYNCS